MMAMMSHRPCSWAAAIAMTQTWGTNQPLCVLFLVHQAIMRVGLSELYLNILNYYMISPMFLCFLSLILFESTLSCLISPFFFRDQELLRMICRSKLRYKSYKTRSFPSLDAHLDSKSSSRSSTKTQDDPPLSSLNGRSAPH